MNVRNVVEKQKDFQKSKLNRHTQSGGGVGAKTAKSAQETVNRIPDQTSHWQCAQWEQRMHESKYKPLTKVTDPTNRMKKRKNQV